MLGTASLDGYFTRLNPLWKRTLGWTVEELTAAPWISFVHPQDVEETDRRREELERGDCAELVNFENRYRARDEDNYRWLSWTATRSDGEICFAARDVTDERAARQALEQTSNVMQAIFESVADGLLVTDAEGALTYVNPAAVQMLGYETSSELEGRNPHKTFHHSHTDGSRYPVEDCALAQVADAGLPMHSEEDNFWRKDGSAVAVSYSSAPVRLTKGVGSVVAFRDITERQAREGRVRRELEELSWVGRVRDALKEDRFVLYAQPIVELATRRAVRHEMLVRMTATDGEVIAPGEFLPAAEEHGLIGALDRRVLELALPHAAAGNAVAINLSGDSISESGLFRHVQERIAFYGADPQLVAFEITETALVHNEGVAQVFIENVRRLGCSVALDDFGTGFGSFRYLKHLPVDRLKIDQEFVRDLFGETAEVNRHVIKAIVALARGMGQETVAEGVEDVATSDLLTSLGVDCAQGYLFAHPAPATVVFPNTATKGTARA